MDRTTPAPRTPRRPRAPVPLVEFRVRTSGLEDGLGAVLRRHALRARLVACRPSDRNGRARLLRWVDLEGASDELDRLEAALAESALPGQRLALSIGRGRGALRLSGPMPDFCATVFASGGICVACPLLDADAVAPVGSTRVLVPRDGSAVRLGRAFGRREVEPISLERTGPFRARASRTPRQEEALRIAFELGYFAYPRRARLEDVARRLGVGRSAALELLRRAVSDLAAHQYAGGPRAVERF